jgi:hypothetical protein
MKKTISAVIFIIMALPAFSQRSADYGASAGIITYIGDLNPQNVFYNPGPALSLFYRYNFNPRQAVRANLLGGYITPLSSYLGELGGTYEFNFFPYSTFRSRHVDYTPYIAGGAAMSIVFNPDISEHRPFLSIPFSAGFKVNVANHIGVEIEYGFRKTFYDKFDGRTEEADLGHKSWTHNNDWYSFLGVSITWKMYNTLAGCPAFAEMGKSKKRKR